MCGGKIYTRTGTITSPGFPKSYQPSQECIWIITAPAGKQIELVVESFELEQHSPCESDFLEIRFVTDSKPFQFDFIIALVGMALMKNLHCSAPSAAQTFCRISNHSAITFTYDLKRIRTENTKGSKLISIHRQMVRESQ